jgi:uncharacterized protein
MIERLSSAGHMAPARTATILQKVETAHRMRDTRTNVNVGSVLQTGRELFVREALLLPEFSAFSFPAPVDVALTIRRVGSGLELKGSIDGPAEGECARCLEPVRLPLHLETNEVFAPNSERGDPLGENNVLDGDELDLRDLVRQLIDSALPIVLLCNDNCPGLCADCGLKRDGTCRCQHPE